MISFQENYKDRSYSSADCFEVMFFRVRRASFISQVKRGCTAT